jgi:hypothetical protein
MTLLTWFRNEPKVIPIEATTCLLDQWSMSAESSAWLSTQSVFTLVQLSFVLSFSEVFYPSV